MNMASRVAPTFEQIEKALDAGELEMIRPWGDWVRCRRRGRTFNNGSGYLTVPVYMENLVEASVTTCQGKLGFPDVRIAR